MKDTTWSDLDSHQDVTVSDHFDEGYAVVGVLVERLMEDDNSSKAAVDPIVCADEDLPELSAVLLGVLHSHLGQTLPHAACGEHMIGILSIQQGLVRDGCRCVTDQQTRLQPGCPSLEKLYGEPSPGAPSSAPRRASGPGVSCWRSNSLWMNCWWFIYTKK